MNRRTTRILYLITSSTIGGTELALHALCRRLDRLRFAPTVVSLKPAGGAARRIRDLGIAVHSLEMQEDRGPLAAAELLLGARRLPALFPGERFDIVHSFLFRAHVLARLAARRLGAVAVVNSYRSIVEGRRPALARIDRLTSGRVTVFHLQSQRLAEDLQRRLGIGAERCVVIPNGIDLAEADRTLAMARASARERCGLSRADLAVAYVGRLHAEKGVPQLLAAFHGLLQRHPTARLLLAGGGPGRGECEAQVAALRLGPHVRFLDEVPSAWGVLAAADLFVLPSLWEGMPNALLEAMAAGLPCVATAVGAVPEIIADGREGLLVPARDVPALVRAMDRLASDRRLREELGHAARAAVAVRFRLEDTVAAMERLYERLAAVPTPAAD